MFDAVLLATRDPQELDALLERTLPLLSPGAEVDLLLAGSPAPNALEEPAAVLRARGYAVQCASDSARLSLAIEARVAETPRPLVVLPCPRRAGVLSSTWRNFELHVLDRCSTTLLLREGAGRFARILLPLDGSAWCAQITPLVATVAAAHGAEVSLLLARPVTLSVGALRAHADALVPDSEALLARSRALLAEAKVPHRTLTSTQDVVEAILRRAEEERADLIAVSTHGHTGLLHTLFGSRARAVLHYARTSVLVHNPEV
ncbi:MAG: universal stress protein [Planctomycetes bacterium]|nr:universal stress protein [Planctomycetota bacterium]